MIMSNGHRPIGFPHLFQQPHLLSELTCLEQVFGYYASGSESESTLRDNRAAFGRYRLLPRIMVDVSQVDTTCTLLGATRIL
jgi:isopentenyl diphosphate isomerase/L-lactate dehydrogenase-like FMN-dependent dehydrogenase